MLSHKILDQLELVCRLIKKKDLCFGGMQIVSIGDFYQLPPVRNHLYGENGHYCFESEQWQNTLTHHVNLDVVIRQTETPLIIAVRETAIGAVSPETVDLLQKSAKDLPNPVRLFATNFLKDMCNASIFNNVQGEQHLIQIFVRLLIKRWYVAQKKPSVSGNTSRCQLRMHTPLRVLPHSRITSSA